jgi:phosphatidate cytidylyltransferase
MKRVLTAVALIPVVLLLVFKAPIWLFVVALGVLIVLSLHEYLNIIKAYGIEPVEGLSYVFALVMLVATWMQRYTTGFEAISRWWPGSWDILVLAPIIFGIPIVARRDMRMALPAAATSAFGLLYIAAALSGLIQLRVIPHERGLIVFILFSVWAGDIAAYYVGKNFGRHKLAPVVSPNKSWEGAIASIVASILVSFVVFHNYSAICRWFSGPNNEYGNVQVTLANILMLGIITNVAAQFGDLFESALKRGAGVKDSGTLLPGHGGILDRIDALLFAIPAACYYANLTRNFY